MTTYLHFIYPPKFVQIGSGHHVNFCVRKKSAITFGEGCIAARGASLWKHWRDVKKIQVAKFQSDTLISTRDLFFREMLRSNVSWLNSLRPRLNRRPFKDDIFKCISLKENEWISPRISLKFVPKVRINNIPALVQIMAWRPSGDKPLSAPMMVSLPTHMRHSASMS